MLYLGIDQHRSQLTISLRDEQGTVVLRQQVSTTWERVREFFAQLRDRCAAETMPKNYRGRPLDDTGSFSEGHRQASAPATAPRRRLKIHS